MHPYTEIFHTILSALKFFLMFLKSDIISEHFVLKNCAIVSYYKDRHVWRHWQYIELISTAPFKNDILIQNISISVVAR